MAIEANNIIVGDNVVYTKKEMPVASPNKPKSFRDQINLNNGNIYENKLKYHETHDGELHKLHNIKSDYLSDILDLKNNK